MAARRCVLCGVNYPHIEQFVRCPLHDEETTPINASPDANWKERLAALKKQVDAAAEISRPIPLVHNVEPYIDHELLWLDHNTLFDAGLRLPRGSSFRLLELDDGFIYETQGWDEPGRRWWVERVVESA